MTEPVQTDVNLTPDPTPPVQPEPTADEAPLLAGKYKTTEELEKAYKELETKLGAQTEPEPAPPAQPPAAEPKEPLTVAGLPADKYFGEYAEKGELSEASYKELADKGIPKELVDAYIAGQKAAAQQQQSLNDTVVNSLIEEAGGEETFGKMAAWANTAYTAQEKADYQAAVDSGSPALARLAVASLKAKYEAAFGTAPDLTEGTSAPGTTAYRSNAEMVAAMRDPRYQTDPAYRQEVERKVTAMK